MIGVSSCLCGINCKYNGKNNLEPIFLQLLNEGKLVPICPEQLGGLKTPRVPAEIQEDENKKRKVINKDGIDVTSEYSLGAERTLEILKALDIKKVIFRRRSPSCGCGEIYDGSFTGTIVNGNGITSELLLKNGIEVITDEEYIKKLENR
ncbi:DUF523 domain-containing protein [Fusobacterium sp.]|uniref:DUF523 domain-containing protein n=1 Tax=Fusobacterium sp. TaxID=68766 RepID=UPI00261E7729|nr:DUF523 domain-containing protein [Fusobacterium sp.]